MYSSDHRQEKQREAQARYRARQRAIHPPMRDWAPGRPKYETAEERTAARTAASLRCRGKTRDQYNAYMCNWRSAKYRELRAKAFELHGAKCTHCGFDNIKALQLDHIKPMAIRYRRRKDPGLNVTLDALLFPEWFQVLCANCNYIKRVDRREAPSLYT